MFASPIRPDSLPALDHENQEQVEEGTGLEPDSVAVRNKRTRGYVFTANGAPATLDEYDVRLKHTVLSLQAASGSVVYCICAKEVGESGTYHLQGFVYFANPRSFDGAKAFLSSAGVNCHVEAARGTPRQAADYCKKGSGTKEEPRDPDFWELGTIPVQGKRNDFTRVFGRVIEEGLTLKRAATEAKASGDYSDFLTLARHTKVLATVEGALLAPRRYDVDRPIRVFWFYGDTGSGKSRAAIDIVAKYEESKESGFFVPKIKAGQVPWFTDYAGEALVILDDFRPVSYQFDFLLSLLDCGPMKVCIGTGIFRQMTTRNFIITCPEPPEMCYMEEGTTRQQQLIRRITDKRHFECFEGNPGIFDTSNFNLNL